MELSEKEAHCVARLLQGAMFGKNNTTSGCAFCKYQCDNEEKIVPMCRLIQKKFEEETGVDLDDTISLDLIYSDFPYKKFLKNVNENIKDFFRNKFADI